MRIIELWHNASYAVRETMDVRQLEMFRAVAEEGTFTRAAERLHVSQSAISRQLQLLEVELRTQLLRRTHHGVVLTPDGEVLLTTANRVNSEIIDAVSQISGARELQRGTLSLGGGMTVALYVFPKLLKKFRSIYRNVDLKVTTGEADSLLRLLRTREIDLALLTLPIVAADLEVVPVLKEEMLVVTAHNHPLGREHSADAKKLARYPFILFESGSNTRKVVDDFLREEGVPVDVVMQTENVEIIKAMVASGLGISFLPYSAIAREAQTGRFAWTRVRGRKLFRETGWIYLKAEYIPRAVTEVLRVFDGMKKQFSRRTA